MPELLLEVGCEELPASFVEKAGRDLLNLVTAALQEAEIFDGEGTVLGTPRRLIVSFPNVLARQADTEKESRGPSIKAAFAADGSPAPALLGFCRAQGVDVSAVRKDDQYVWVTKKIAGRDTIELLSELLPKAIRGLSFEKSMRWGSARMRFARPIRWILATFGGVVPAFEIEGVWSGNESRGHRFYAPESFRATSISELVDGLRARFVEPDASIRRARILTESRDVAGGVPDLPEALVEENAYLTEWPTAIVGEFRPEFMDLPDAVLIMAMAKHEKMFPVRNSEGNLTNRFVFVRNSGEDASVRKGCEWVLNARFNDAKFFYDEDRKCLLDEFLSRTSGIMFQQKLGTIRARAERLSALAGEIARQSGRVEEVIASAKLAGKLSKADLSTGLVGELPALQGVIGADYARREGVDERVCWAIESHYDLAKNLGRDFDDATLVAIATTVADQIDRLVGYLGLGLAPSGSSDPYALRRAATMLIEAAWAWVGPRPSYVDLLPFAIAQYRNQGVELDESAIPGAFTDVLAGRYGSLIPSARHDVLDAAILRDFGFAAADPVAVKFRIEALNLVCDDATFVQTATRPLNIVAAAAKKGLTFGVEDPLAEVDQPKLESVEGIDLWNALAEGEASLKRAVADNDGSGAVDRLKALVAPINAFFDKTMIMVEDPDVRYARLTLLNAACKQLLNLGDVTKLVFAG